MKYSTKSIELDFYVDKGISPVHYNLKKINKHFQIRESLYRLLGFPPSFFKGKDVIEIAAGSGHNSIYTSTLLPNSFDLVEPNPIGCKDIKKTFKDLKQKHTKPKLYQEKLDDFKNSKLYDVVITEGWPGGYLNYDKSMLKKMSKLVKPGGVLLISFLPPIGAMATYLRRLIAHRLITTNNNIKQNTKTLSRAFSSHLNNLSSMGRSHEHWIQDSLLNPYLCVAYNTPSLCNKIFKNKFKVYNSVPRFNSDWRWYKSLYGNNRSYNENFLTEYNSVSHCLIDFRMNESRRHIKKNIILENLCSDFAIITKNFENLGYKEYLKKVKPTLFKIINNLNNDVDEQIIKSFKEVDILLSKQQINVNEVSKMLYFSKLFGREQCYLSFINQ